MNLYEKKCVACKQGTKPLKGEELNVFYKQINPDWKLIDEHHLKREYAFKNFSQALEFTNQIGQLAEEQRHHPDIFLSWGKVVLTVFTHKIKGLSESDFIFAAKCDQIKS